MNKSTQHRAGRQPGSHSGDGADSEVDRDAALLRPVHVLQTQQQRELVDDQREPGTVRERHGSVRLDGVPANRHSANPGEKPDTPEVVMYVGASDEDIAKWSTPGLDAVGDSPHGREGCGETRPAENDRPARWVEFLAERRVEFLRCFGDRRCHVLNVGGRADLRPPRPVRPREPQRF